MKRRKLWKQDEYDQHPVMVNADQEHFCDEKILKKIKEQFDYAEQTKSKIWFMRYDVRFQGEERERSDNQLFSEFQSKFIKNLTRQQLKPQYVAVREQSREKHQHYHVVLWLDGQKTQSIHNHIQTAERLWDRTLALPERPNGYGLVDDCTKSRAGQKQVNGVMLRKDDPDYESKKDDCFRRASYLAKVNTKADDLNGSREIMTSRIPKNDK